MELKNQIIEVLRNGEYQIVSMEDLKPGETFRIKPLERKIKYINYLHSDKDSNWTKARELGLDDNEKFMYNFAYSLYEIKLEMEADTETGETWILAINGVKLEEPVKA